MVARFFGPFCIFTAAAVFSFLVIPQDNRGAKDFFKKNHAEICEKVFRHFYELNKELEDWHKACLEASEGISNSKTVSEFHKREQNLLNQLETSHLEFFSPESNRLLWLSESLDTGVRARKVENKFIVHELVEEGPGVEAGLQLGDEILSINGQPLASAWDVRSEAGRFKIQREKETFEVLLEARSLQIDDDPKVFSINESLGLLRIPSFIASHFEEEALQGVLEQAFEFDRLIVDLRGNSGGDFVAMLRVLSAFFCKSQQAGMLIQPRKKETPENRMGEFLENFGPNDQLEVLANSYKINLKSFERDSCFDGPVTVFVDEHSASVSEIFAEAIRGRPLTRIWGNFSSGSVVLAVWHPLSLGKGYSLSIPQATYESPTGLILEGRGVWPDKVLRYDLALSLRGQDSWVEAVAKSR